MSEPQYSAFTALKSLIRPRQTQEHCELCAAGLGLYHQHLIEPNARKLVCVCDACSILFSSTGQTKYRRVPRRVRFLRDFEMTDGQWESLLIPIGMAFFLKSSAEEKILAFYPGPAGSTESLLPLECWNDIVQGNPVLNEMQSDVEAFLVNRIDHARGGSEYYLAPIDKCYELVGLIRSNWRGLSGGTEVWEKIKRFFDELKENAAPERSNA
ncbi:MAG: DUF5947 family protein [Bryobacteraceae bacterium]